MSPSIKTIKENGKLRSEVTFIGEFFPDEFRITYYDKLHDWCLYGAVWEYINYQLTEDQQEEEYKVYVIWVNSYRPETIMFKGKTYKFFIA